VYKKSFHYAVKILAVSIRQRQPQPDGHTSRFSNHCFKCFRVTSMSTNYATIGRSSNRYMTYDTVQRELFAIATSTVFCRFQTVFYSLSKIQPLCAILMVHTCTLELQRDYTEDPTDGVFQHMTI
jgi:hypothetical protein